MINPLLENTTLPPFSAINAEHVEPAIEQLIDDGRKTLRKVLADVQNNGASWATLSAVIDEEDDRLSKAWSPVGHLNGVLNSEALRVAYTNSIAKLTAYSTEISQNPQLCAAYQALADSDEFASLSQAQQTSVEHALRNFRLAGVDLPADKKQAYSELKQRLSELSTQFSNNVLDATQGWFKHIVSADELAGLPETALGLARQAAQAKSLEGYVVTLDVPSYLAVMTYAQDRALREELYTAYATRASERGPTAGQWDNSALIEETLKLRHQLAQLLGFANYAELSLATKMADSPQQVEEFLLELAENSREMAKADLESLQAFAQQEDGIDQLQAWDQSYYSEKLKAKTFSVSQEELRPYFPAETVVNGMFAVASRLFAIELRQAQADVWHGDVRYYEVLEEGEVIASFYLDIYARAHKRGGAWMDVCRTRQMTSQGLQLPVAYLTCNFTPALGDKPSLLTHDEVTTLFHEFGHGLHHMLTKVDVQAVSGISGVAWDAVELPSQFLENWCWEPAAIALISGHYETGEPLPETLLNNLLAAKNFQSALQMLRQIEFSLFDLRLHSRYNPDNPESVLAVLDQVRDEISVVKPPVFNRFANSFSHIFAGGYAAGYYSYKWAEVLSADAFSRFEEEGVFNQSVGLDFRRDILEQGGSKEAMVLFCAFRGREPSTEPLLRHCGIVK